MKLILFLITSISCLVFIATGALVDLTHITDNETLHHALYFPFQMEIMQRGYGFGEGQLIWYE